MGPAPRAAVETAAVAPAPTFRRNAAASSLTRRSTCSGSCGHRAASRVARSEKWIPVFRPGARQVLNWRMIFVGEPVPTSPDHALPAVSRLNNSTTIPKSYGEPFVKPQGLACVLSPSCLAALLVRSVCHDCTSIPPVGADGGSRRACRSHQRLARAYLYSDLSHDDRAAAEGAMIMLLDDPSPLVRHALADALGSSRDAPAAVVHALVNDQPDIAALVLERSPLLLDSDLVDAIAVGGAELQSAIARRAYPAALGVGCHRRSRLAPRPASTLIENPAPTSRRSRSTASWSASGISRRSASRCSHGRPAGRDPAGAGDQAVGNACGLRGGAQLAAKRAGRSASRRKPARRRP